jgi:oxygen-independent coproporphyrinogen-3 oxidase
VVPVEEYVERVVREIDLRFPEREGWRVGTLYMGGGTPSRLGAAGIGGLMERLGERFTLAKGAEVTIEANPDDITVEAVRSWRESGVNRLSIGIQSFDDRVLSWMHRTHNAAQAARAVEAARAGGIEQLSLDLIFALPEALGRDWERDLSSALALEPSHISLYGLTIEPATPLGRWRDRGQVTEAPDERYEEEFLHAHHRLVGAGFEHYEVSNYARPGARARHNSSYWHRVPYAGFGPSAHSFDGDTRRWNLAAYAEWCRALEDEGDPVGGSELLTEENVAAEDVYLGLRTREGLEVSPGVARHVQSWVQAGWAVVEGARLRLTPAGWLRLDSLAADLTAIGSRL